MGSSWKKIVLGDLLTSGDALLQTGPFGTALKAEEYTETGVPLISVREIREGVIEIESKTPRVDSTVTQRLPKFVLKSGDIIFARKGGIERNALITEREHGWFVGSDGIYLRLSDKYCSEYYSYVMRSPKVKKWLLKNCEGTTMPSLNQKILSRIPIFEPPLIEQRKVAKVLRAFDKKISLNNQINQTLEQMAQTLFKSWFVDFDPVIDNALDAGYPIPEVFETRVECRKAVRESADFKPLPDDVRELFPSEFEESELGWVPKGWEFGAVSDLLVLQRGFDLPKTKRVAGDFALIASSGQDGTHNEAKVKGPGITTGRSGKIGIVTFVYGDFWPLNTTLWVKEYRASNPYHALFYLKTLPLETLNSGSAVPTLNRNYVHNLPAVVPSSSVLDKFESLVSSSFGKMNLNQLENESLTILRDTLLPKLTSGELCLDSPEVEQAKVLVD
ncbi:restriction endonuclease subunit S [Vibrio hyugaensis]|uniref:restriction endonuclease subunit S n=1 Tax=Vibrio hyugaensis TaxID=1534743 RepID=UPI0005EFE92F|nr:restriction endonuclease subunit S [Vibrio hyugaensis]